MNLCRDAHGRLHPGQGEPWGDFHTEAKERLQNAVPVPERHSSALHRLRQRRRRGKVQLHPGQDLARHLPEALHLIPRYTSRPRPTFRQGDPRRQEHGEIFWVPRGNHSQHRLRKTEQRPGLTFRHGGFEPRGQQDRLTGRFRTHHVPHRQIMVEQIIGIF